MVDGPTRTRLSLHILSGSKVMFWLNRGQGKLWLIYGGREVVIVLDL